MTELHLARLPLRLRPFTEWALSSGYLATPAGDGKGKPRDADPGYALHALLTGLFGEMAPRPFCPPPPGQRESRARTGELEIWGYAPRPMEELAELAKLAESRLFTMVDWESVRSKPMPARWPLDIRLRFDLRACPVKRLAQPLTVRAGIDGWEDTLAKGAEVDAYQVAIARGEPGSAEPNRYDVYRDWLVERLPTEAVRLERDGVRIDSHRSTRMLRRPCEGGHKTGKWLTRPDVRFSGMLKVIDGEVFNRLLTSGVGRHCGFGFGMLLLKPA